MNLATLKLVGFLLTFIVLSGFLWSLYAGAVEKGRDEVRDQVEAHLAEYVREKTERNKAMQAKQAEDAAANAAAEAKVREKTNVVTREVVRYVERNPSDPVCVLPPDLVELLNAARRPGG